MARGNGPEPQRRAGWDQQRGQASVLVVAVVAVVLAVLLALSRLGQVLVHRAHAAAAADAVALAALNGGEAGAASVAAANEAVIIELRIVAGWARATVRYQGEQATSTAALVEDEAERFDQHRARDRSWDRSAWFS